MSASASAGRASRPQVQSTWGTPAHGARLRAARESVAPDTRLMASG